MNLKAVYTKQYEGCVFFDSALAAAPIDVLYIMRQ